jgi:hypothetical protein
VRKSGRPTPPKAAIARIGWVWRLVASGFSAGRRKLKLEMKLTGNTNSGILCRSARNAGRGGGGGGGAGRGGAAGAAAPPQGAAADQAAPAVVSAASAQQVTPVVEPCSSPQYAGAGRATGGARGGGRGPGAPGQPGGPGQQAGGGRAANPRNVGGYQYDFNVTGRIPDSSTRMAATARAA